VPAKSTGRITSLISAASEKTSCARIRKPTPRALQDQTHHQPVAHTDRMVRNDNDRPGGWDRGQPRTAEHRVQPIARP
jgi:hypothetical protein